MLQREIEFIKRNRVVYRAIKKISEHKNVWGLILFGSYSKRTETKNSDVDLICITNNSKVVEGFVKSLKYENNIKFSPVIMPLHEFPNIKKDNPQLWEDLKLYGITFKGDGYFYAFMYQDG